MTTDAGKGTLIETERDMDGGENEKGIICKRSKSGEWFEKAPCVSLGSRVFLTSQNCMGYP